MSTIPFFLRVFGRGQYVLADGAKTTDRFATSKSAGAGNEGIVGGSEFASGTTSTSTSTSPPAIAGGGTDDV